MNKSNVNEIKNITFALAAYVIAAVMFTDRVQSQPADGDLRKALIDLRFETNVAVAEAECAKMVASYSNQPEALGRIYLALALNNCYRLPGQTNGSAKIIENSQKALNHPLDVMDACDAYSFLGAGLHMKIMNGLPEREETAVRKQALDVFLKGLKLVLSKAKTLQKQEVPMFGGFSVVGDTNNPWYQKQYQDWQAQVKAHDDAKAANALVDRYEWFKQDVIDLYRGVPHAEEITQEGEKIMPGAPVLKELADEVEKSNILPKSARITPTR